VDVATHLLVSLALVRAFFPRCSWRFVSVVVLAGVLADIDLLTLFFGPDAYLSGRFTWTHSILGTLAIIAASTLLVVLFTRKSSPPQKAAPANTGFAAVGIATCIAAIAHVLTDLATSRGIALLWPFRQTRFAGDLLPTTDPWILILLIAGILLPELFALVSSEIGARDKAPRGRNGARLALALLCIYVGVRFSLHTTAAARLDAHAYRGESPRRVAALPDSLSPFTWHGIAETTSQICTMDVPAMYASRFDSESSVCVHKPEPSSAFTAAQQTEAAQRFVAAARFPKASVDTFDLETVIVIRDVRDLAEEQSRLALAARILVDSKGQVTSQHIVWARNVRLR